VAYVVDYGVVRRYALSAIVHEQAVVTAPMIQGWLDEATNNIFLKDSLPWGGSIKQRYEDDEDVHCPIALVLKNPDEPLATFSGSDVVEGGEVAQYNEIQNKQEYDQLLATPWSGNNVAYGYDLIVVTNLLRSSGNGTMNGWGNGGELRDANNGHIWLMTENRTPDRSVAHEWGHYKGGLLDRYICEDCGQNPCTCGNRSWVDPPDHPDNFMGTADPNNVGVLNSDKAALTR
jgi:hypothetical protein